MRTRLLLFCLFPLFVCPLLGLSQGFLQTKGKEIVDENDNPVILKGMGLGGWMLQEGYMLQTAGFANAQYEIRGKIEELIGPADTDLFYEAWLENHARKIDIDSLKAWGFNSVRLPMHYNLFTLPIEDEPVAGQQTWLTKGFELTDSLISWCKANQMYVILDLHAAPGGQGMDAAISDYDPSKPSLWESKDNRDKTVALWKRIAERYANEPWVGGYDLINETNWSMTGNTPLRDLYFEITDSIRTVDTNHIIFIEGNWWANDFTGLTPPWDDNMVYSPHKYWSINDQASIQWVLDIRETYDVPLYLGESGENSNVWFRDAIKLLEDHNIGWAWWPMKKIQSIAGPLSIEKSTGYQDLLDYWENGGTAPSAATAKATLMALTEDLKLENCVYQKDVIDAMFRQVESDEAIPYRIQDIPGVVYATDFDMGVVGSAYFDSEVANYQVSTGNYTSWNNGWSYRNDGVDIEVTSDNINSNGYNVGWLGTGEWMQYTVEVAADAVYDVEMRYASDGTDGRFHLTAGTADLGESVSVPSTGGWQTWQTLNISNLILTQGDNKIRFYVDQEGFNLNSLKFIQKGATTTISTRFASAFTIDQQSIQLNLNKPLTGPLPSSPADFTIYADGNPISITSTSLDNANPRIITFDVNHSFKSSESIRISYNGSQIEATDGTPLTSFSQRVVQNTIAIVHPVPGKVEAEDFFAQSGIQLENTTDTGGGQNIGYLDAGDFLDYYIEVEQNGTYEVTYRTAAESEMGGVRMELINNDGSTTALHSVTFPSTGGWQTWASTSQSLSLDAGKHQLRLVITQPLFNINWFDFTFLTSLEKPDLFSNLQLFPNPGTGLFFLQGNLDKQQAISIEVMNMMGQTLSRTSTTRQAEINERIDLTGHPNGYYLVKIQSENGETQTRKLVKQ